jgi:hypothetical protein
MSQDDLERLANNPQRGINLIVDEIEKNWFNGTVKLNSKAHPAVLCMDLILGTSHGFLNRLSDANSKVALKHARNVSDLSRNMSDDERFGLFANPADSMMQYAISEDAFKDIAKDVTVTQGKTTMTYKVILIPKDTVFDVNGYSFAVNNGIELRYSEKAGWQAVYDEQTNNPFQPIGTNLIDKDKKLVNGTMYRLFNIPVTQLAIKATENITSNEGSGCRGTVDYPDYLFGVRAFLVQNGVLSEIAVSFDQDVFDPLTVTLALDIDTVNNVFNYEIPDVYITNKLGVGSIRIYTYTTKGVLSKNLTLTPSQSITPNYQDFRYGAGKLGDTSVMLRNAKGAAWAMVDVTTGGTNPVPFNVMKQALIDGRRQRNTPITESNLKGMVENYGYGSVKTIDYLTGRAYSLSKELPIQDNKGFYAPMSCYVGSHLASANDLVGAGVVLDNGKRITIPHNVLFDITTPTSKLVNDLTKNRYLGMTSDQIVDLMGANTLVYTPFYYVLDMTNNQAVLRTYHLDAPVVRNQTFVAENSTLGFELGVGSIAIEHVDTGYLITIVTKSNDAYKQLDNNQLAMQLSISPQDSSSLASIAGTLIGVTADTNERIFQFNLDTKFDVDVNDILYFTNLHQFGAVQPSTGSTLAVDMTFIFCFVGDMEFSKSDSDAKIDQTLFAEDMVAIIETAYGITFGKKMGNLYSRIRPLVGEAQYLRYAADVPETYTTNVMKRVNGELVFDPDTNLPIMDQVAGQIVYNDDGTPRLLYRAGIDVVYQDGVPVMVAPRDLKYHWDFIAFDGNYFFSDDQYDIQFALDTKNYFVNVISKDLEAFTSESLDRTELFYQPRSKLGYQKVVVNSNYESFLKQDLEFTITYYLTGAGYKNQNLKDALSASSPRVINEALYGATTIGITNFVTSLMQDAGEQVVTVKLSAISGDTTVDVISNVDNLTGFSVRKNLKLLGDGGVGVKEAIDIIFLPHDASVAGA